MDFFLDPGSCEEVRMITNQKSSDGDHLLRSGQESFKVRGIQIFF